MQIQQSLKIAFKNVVCYTKNIIQANRSLLMKQIMVKNYHGESTHATNFN